MLLFAGLGNPGPRHAGNRHNIGFMAVDAIVRRHGFPPARSRFSALVQEGRLGEEKVVAIRPQTFMNESGRAVGEAMRFYRLEPADIVVFHDELDLAPGKLKVKRGGGHAGHNGLRSIIAHVGADFTRVRLGIGHPGDRDLVTPWVLSDFAKADGPWVETLCEAIAEAAPWLAAGDPARFMTEVARLTVPQDRNG